MFPSSFFCPDWFYPLPPWAGGPLVSCPHAWGSLGRPKGTFMCNIGDINQVGKKIHFGAAIVSTLIISVQHGCVYKSPLRNQKRDTWNNISKRHGNLLLLIITTCKAWKCLRCSYFFEHLTGSFIYTYKKKKANWGDKIICCCRNMKVTFLVLFPGWCHSEEFTKGHDFPEGAFFFFRADCLWALIAPSEVRSKPGWVFFCLVWQYQIKPIWSRSPKPLGQALSVPSYTFWIVSLGVSQLLGLCAGWWEVGFPLLCGSLKGCHGYVCVRAVPNLTPEVDHSTM